MMHTFSKQILIIFCTNKGVNASVMALAEKDRCDVLRSPHNDHSTLTEQRIKP